MENPANGAPAASLGRQIGSALAVAAFCAGIWWFIDWRSAPRPPPRPLGLTPQW